MMAGRVRWTSLEPADPKRAAAGTHSDRNHNVQRIVPKTLQCLVTFLGRGFVREDKKVEGTSPDLSILE